MDMGREEDEEEEEEEDDVEGARDEVREESVSEVSELEEDDLVVLNGFMPE